MKLRYKLLSLVVCALFSTNVLAANGSSDPIKVAINDWTGQHLTAHITGQLLQKAGFNIEFVTAGTVPQLAAIAQGNIHLQTELWDNNVGDIYHKAVEDGEIIVVGPLGLQAREGWMYPGYMEEKCPGLPSHTGLIECAQAFAGPDTFPKGRVITYPASWGTKSKDLIEAAELPFQPVAGGSDGAMIAELKAAYAANEPSLMMFWAPHWLHAELDMKWVDMPPAHPNCGSEPEHGFSPDHVNDCGFEQANVLKIVWHGFGEKWPGALKLVEALTIDNDVQNNLMLEVDIKKRSLEEVVTEWIDANESVWADWVAAAQ